MRHANAGRGVGLWLALLAAATSGWSLDWSEGQMSSVPVSGGKAPVIDGVLDDWDLSWQEPVYIAESGAHKQNVQWAFMHDDDALYVGVVASLPGRPYTNPNMPQDAFWWSDLIQFRLASDPDLPYPLNRGRDAHSNRVVHLSAWKNSDTGADYLHLGYGVELNLGSAVNPPGSAVKFVIDGDKGFVAEIRIPWAALNVPDGRNPFKPDEAMTLVTEMLWIGGDMARVAACYRRNPGTFAFNSPDTWGRLALLGTSPGQRQRPTMEAILAAIKPDAPRAGDSHGVPLTLEVPEDGLKVSVNILGENGAVLRELIGGQPLPQGTHTLLWNGRDAWDKPLPAGEYAWGAYMHKGLKAEFAGTVGTSGTPPEHDGTDNSRWGGDHSNPIGCAADASGRYFLWPVAEAGRPLVKTDYDGRVLWRKNPFVGGGFGPFYAVASDGRFVYLARGINEVFLSRLDAATGALQTWGEGGPSELSIFSADPVKMNGDDAPLDAPFGDTIHQSQTDYESGIIQHPNTLGLASRDGKVYVGAYAEDRIHIVDAATAAKIGTLEVPGPRGLSFDADGNLLAVSFVPGRFARVVRFANAAGAAATVVEQGLEAPCGVAVDAEGRFHVTDLGTSQQVKVFGKDGAAIAARGQAGGRVWQGRYDPDAFLKPSGICLDAQGQLLIVESSAPKVFSLMDPATGAISRRWYGPGVYWNATFADPSDPELIYYSLTEALGRARLAGPGKVGVPEAYWMPGHAGYPHVGSIEGGMPHCTIVEADNGRRYLVKDATPQTVFLFENDQLRPVCRWRATRAGVLETWIDANGDGLPQENENRNFDLKAHVNPSLNLAPFMGSILLEPNGDLYFITNHNQIVRIPATGFADNGTIGWDLDHITTAIPEVLPGRRAYNANNEIHCTWRHGILGVRRDGTGNFYTVLNAQVPGRGGENDYADPETAKRMMEGMGHAATFNIVKFGKYAPDGRPLWLVGRKATGGARPGEMYHFWNLAGLVGDRYVAGGSEWGLIYFYTHDGFYVDKLMEDPGDLPAPGPYTYGGETSGGRIAYFPDRDEVWAYSTGNAFRVKGFEKGVVAGERRVNGRVTLDQTYASAAAADDAVKEPLRLVRRPADADAAARWREAPVAEVVKQGKTLARAQLAYDNERLHARIEVLDATPLDNAADTVDLAFKGGDTAGIVLGPQGERRAAGPGDIRLMAARIGGAPRLIAMKASSAGDKKPFKYTTPATGDALFDFVGEAPGGVVALTPTAAGYVAEFSVPRAFLELDLAAGATLSGDVEIREGGAGQRGHQTVARNYFFTPARPETTMVDDVPTEARMYPAYWGGVVVE